MRKTITTVSLLAVLTLLSACGNDPGERALTGGGIGAGGGAVGAALLGADPLLGAVIGGAGGALIGAGTAPHH